ncbi:MAG: hypothetical protein ACI936_001595 [Paraglaciecola sp.]|jgi:hypothetical protein
MDDLQIYQSDHGALRLDVTVNEESPLYLNTVKWMLA